MDDSVDGTAIDVHMARVSGSFDIDPIDNEHMTMFKEGMLVIRFTSRAPSFADMASGAIKRTNVLKVQSAALVRDMSLQKLLADALGLTDDEVPLLTRGPIGRIQAEHVARHAEVKAELTRQAVRPAGALVQGNALEEEPATTADTFNVPVVEDVAPEEPVGVRSHPIPARSADPAFAAFLDET